MAYGRRVPGVICVPGRVNKMCSHASRRRLTSSEVHALTIRPALDATFDCNLFFIRSVSATEFRRAVGGVVGMGGAILSSHRVGQVKIASWNVSLEFSSFGIEQSEGANTRRTRATWGEKADLARLFSPSALPFDNQGPASSGVRQTCTEHPLIVPPERPKYHDMSPPRNVDTFQNSGTVAALHTTTLDGSRHSSIVMLWQPNNSSPGRRKLPGWRKCILDV